MDRTGMESVWLLLNSCPRTCVSFVMIVLLWCPASGRICVSLSEGNTKTCLEQIPVTDSPRPMGLIRAHSPRSVNPLNPSYPSKSVFKKKLDAIMVCPIRSRSVVKMWGDNIWYVLIKWYDSYEHRITSWHILNCVPHFAKRDPFFARRLFLFVKFWRDFTFKKKIWVISVSILLPSEEKDVSLTGQKAKGWISARESIP